MTFEILKNKYLLVNLSPADMRTLDFSYSQISDKSIETHKALFLILNKAEKALGEGFFINKRLFVEASPLNDGGCTLLFSKATNQRGSDKSPFIIKKDAEQLLFCAFHINAFIDALTFLKKATSLYTSFKVYRLKSLFFILISTAPTNRQRLCFSLSEFGKAGDFSPQIISEIREYGTPLDKLS